MEHGLRQETGKGMDEWKGDGIGCVARSGILSTIAQTVTWVV